MAKILQNNKGITILEIILTIVLLTFGTIPIIQCLSRGLTIDQIIEGQSIALKLAQQQIEQLENSSSYSTILSLAPGVAEAPCASPFTSYNCEVDVSPSTDNNLITVTSNVYYGKNQQYSVSLVTYITKVAGAYPGT